MTTIYTVYNRAAENGSDDYLGDNLSAKTDKSARIEAKKIAVQNGWTKYGIRFFRESDHCRGEIDV
jgi:hypothetical protein